LLKMGRGKKKRWGKHAYYKSRLNDGKGRERKRLSKGRYSIIVQKVCNVDA